MLSQQEEDFLDYWEKNRGRQKKITRQLFLGIPVGLLFIVPMVLNLASGWDKRADLVANRPDTFNSLIILLAFLIISVFIAILSRRMAWEKNEQRYQALKSRKSETPAG